VAGAPSGTEKTTPPTRDGQPADPFKPGNETASTDPINVAPVTQNDAVRGPANEDRKNGRRETQGDKNLQAPGTEVAGSEKQKKQDNNLPKPENNPYVNAPDPRQDPVIADANVSNPTLTTRDKNSPASPVTTGTPGAYNNQEFASGKTGDDPDAIFASNDEKKNKHRGFFRKLARTFEKRTNIKATDGENDDRLLIAGLAIKLN
jgi:hypothetical protein